MSDEGSKRTVVKGFIGPKDLPAGVRAVVTFL